MDVFLWDDGLFFFVAALNKDECVSLRKSSTNGLVKICFKGFRRIQKLSFLPIGNVKSCI